MKKAFVLSIAIFSIGVFPARAEVIRGIEIEFLAIGNPSNPGDTRLDANPIDCGAVDYAYNIGKYEITNAQWDGFVSAAGAPTGSLVDGSSPYDRSAYWTGDNIPTNCVSWYEAAQFCNYLTSGDKSKGAYQFSGTNLNPGDFLGIDRDSAISIYGTTYVIPTENEWYKAAYYTSSGYSTFANGTDTLPVAGTDTNYDMVLGQPWQVGVGNGTQEQNHTFDMMGNLWEWNETLLFTDNRGIRGGSYYYHEYLKSSNQHSESPDNEHTLIGFRVASVSESTISPVTLDIKPASCPNPFNTKSKGLLPLAVLGTEIFDVSMIDPTSVRLNGVAPIRSSLEDVTTPLTDPDDCECTTAGPDGFTDLTLKFKTQDIVESIGEVDRDDVLTLPLTGVLSDGTPVEGADCIVIKGRHKPINVADVNQDGVVNVLDMTIFAQNWLESSIVE
jgi:hypothetical protein